jgi:T5orf172 domain-containing protein
MLLFDRPTVKKLIVEILQEHPEGMTSDELRKEVKARFLKQGGNWTDDLDRPAGSASYLLWVNIVAWALVGLGKEGRFIPDLPRHFYKLQDYSSVGEPLTNAENDEDLEEVQRELSSPLEGYLGIHEAIVVGEGPQVVYAYAYPGLEDRLKVGSTNGDPAKRIMQQLGTSSPAWPKVKVLFRCEHAQRLESLLHGWLDELRRRIDAPGHEWFRVSAQELIEMVERVKAPL